MPQVIEIPDIGKVEFPDDMTDEQIVAAIRANTRKAKPPTKDWMRQTAVSATRAEHPILSAIGDFATGATGILRGALNAPHEPYTAEQMIEIRNRGVLGEKSPTPPEKPSYGLGDRVAPEFPGSENSGWRAAGGFLDPAALAIGVGTPAYARVLGGGFFNAGKALARNAVGGAAAGGTIGALSEGGDAESGASIGALLNVTLPPSIRAAGTLAAKTWTAASPKYKAKKILEELLGKDLPAFRAAITRAPAGVTAAQAASKLDNDLLNAADDLARRMDESGYFKGLDEKQSQDVVEGLVSLAGGRNQAEIKQSLERAKTSLGNVTEPFAQESLRLANVAGRAQPRIAALEQRAESLGQQASDRVGRVRRLEGAKSRAEAIARTGRMNQGGEAVPVLGQGGLSLYPVGGPPSRLSPRYPRGEELVGVAERGSQQAADESLVLGAASRNAASKAEFIKADLAAVGLKPIDTGVVTSSLRGMLKDPKIGPASLNGRVLSVVADKIDEWAANNGGVIDAEVLRTIRTNAVNDEIEAQIGGKIDPKGKAKRAAALLGRVRPLIDDAIEAAGGRGWRDYLRDYAGGSRLIERQKMGGKALELFYKDQATLESLAAENEPKMVKAIFKNEYDLGLAMGTKAKQPIEAAAALISGRRAADAGAARGEAAMQNVLRRNKAAWILPNWINAKIAVTNRALKEVEFRVNEKTMRTLFDSLKSGADANKLISLTPPEERNALIRGLLAAQDNPKTRAFLGGFLNGIENQ